MPPSDLKVKKSFTKKSSYSTKKQLQSGIAGDMHSGKTPRNGVKLSKNFAHRSIVPVKSSNESLKASLERSGGLPSAFLNKRPYGMGKVSMPHSLAQTRI